MVLSAAIIVACFQIPPGSGRGADPRPGRAAPACPTPHRAEHRSRNAAELVARRVAERKHADVVGYLCLCGSWHVGPRREVEAGEMWAVNA